MNSLALVVALSIGQATGQGAIPVHAGDPAPVDGVFLTLPKSAEVSTAYYRCTYERDALRERLTVAEEGATGAIWIAGGAGLLLGVIAGVLLAR